MALLQKKEDLDGDGLPIREGVYLMEGDYVGDEKEIDVYEHPIKGLCCFGPDYGAAEFGDVDGDTDCHVSVQYTGITFIRRIRDLD